MIAYLDTSALVPLLIDEAGSPKCEQLWTDADQVATARIAFVEAAAAIAQAGRLGRLSKRGQRDALAMLDTAWWKMQIVEIDQTLMDRAAVLADAHGLRGYDATHCAAAESVNGEELVAGSGDQKLLTAWRALGLNTFDANVDEADGE